MILENKLHSSVLKKFNHPNNLIKEFEHWFWLLRPNQITLGSSILITKNFYTSFSSLPSIVFSEYEIVIKEIELVLHNTFNYDKINHLMLMMNDPTVHFHIIPRYKNDITFHDITYKDFGFPGIPDFQSSNIISQQDKNKIIHELNKK